MFSLAKLGVVCAGPLLGLGALQFAAATGTFSQGVGAPRLIEQPAEWVPFAAVTVDINEKDGSRLVGRFYRASDGSTRHQSGPTDDVVTAIGIKNVPTMTFYSWTARRGWTAQPMQTPPRGYRPVPRSFRRGMVQAQETLEGLTLIRDDIGAPTVVQYLAPALNLHPVMIAKPCQFDSRTTCGLTLSNIQLSEQPSRLFEVPSGSELTFLDKPGGIVRRNGGIPK